MRIHLNIALILIVALMARCSKGMGNDISEITVTNSWECEIGGIPYSGSIDTSFLEIYAGSGSNADTMLYCTGTSADKKANIHFRFYINRRA